MFVCKVYVRFIERLVVIFISMEEYITSEGVRKLKKELIHLKDTKRKEIAQWLREAAGEGDFTENAEYVEAKEAQTALESQIESIEKRLRTATVVPDKKKKGEVSVGAEVELAKSRSKVHRTIRLVSAEDVDVVSGSISADSPMGRALIGKKKGEKVSVVTPKGKKQYTIIRIA